MIRKQIYGVNEFIINLVKTKETINKAIKEVINMPDRNGRGPRQRSPMPSKRKGGRQLGNC